MASVITVDFEKWKAQQAAAGKPVVLDEFVFAYVPDLDPALAINRDEKLPAESYIVHRQAVNKTGLASENAVAYSVTLGTEAGHFDFNWIGLINKASGIIGMITHAPTQKKIKTANKLTGQSQTRTPMQRQIDAAYPELSAGLHLPKFARIEAHPENTVSGDISDPFQPRYAVDVQLLADDGQDAAVPVYHAVPLPLPMAGSESGMFQYPPVGTVVEIAFEAGRPDKPFIRQTLSQGNTLPDIKPGEQLQQQRAEVSQRVTQEGHWIRQTDQTINESSMHREVRADTETRTIVARETTIQATDKTTVLGTSTLLAGAVQQIADGDYSIATSSNFVASVGKEANVEVGQKLIEKIGLLKQSIAGARQEIVAPVVWVGSQQINVMQLMLETLEMVKELSELAAAHTHHNTGTPENASAIRNTAYKSDELKQKYSPVIG